jgi:hypothetical protein
VESLKRSLERLTPKMDSHISKHNENDEFSLSIEPFDHDTIKKEYFTNESTEKMGRTR